MVTVILMGIGGALIYSQGLLRLPNDAELAAASTVEAAETELELGLALAGATLGFLRYNFNPASIFMGDSGSYFLGYSIAALSILGSVKGQATFAMLIPFLALGVPIFDALFSPLRRFAKGRKMLKPRAFHVSDKCKNHRLCIGTFTCPAFSIQGDFPVIDPDTCVGCAVCAQICPENAILPLKK